jgi:hypothetical protein
MTKQYTVTVDKIDFELLKKQKEALIIAASLDSDDKKLQETLDGIIGLLDAITDKIEDGDCIETILE